MDGCNRNQGGGERRAKLKNLKDLLEGAVRMAGVGDEGLVVAAPH